ncbi:MAG: alpha/beta hydrolase [Ilumatobacteraceae bacterium]
MSGRDRFRAAEARLLDRYVEQRDEIYVDLSTPQVRVRAQIIGDGPPVVLINGIGTPGAGFAPLLPELRGHRRVVLDLPGHGLASPYDWQGPAVRDQAVAILAGVIDELGLGRPAIVANSLGGLFALWLALDAPTRVRALVLVGEPATALPGARGIGLMELLSVPIAGKAFEWSMRLPAPRPVIRSVFATAFGRPAVDADADVVAVHALSLRVPGQARSFRSLLQRILDGRTPRPENVLTDDELARLALPILFVWGTDDAFLSPADGRASVAKISGARLEEVPGGHDPWLDDPRRCGELIRRFLDDAL